MSPAQAAQAVNLSRWTILRAIKSQQLKAVRDNRNNWKITKKDLKEWCAHSVQAHKLAPPVQIDETPALRAALAAETARADSAERARDQAEVDRNKWREMALTLTKRRGFIWPWRKTNVL
jgi:excisionase family DNA binding protein